MIYVAKIAVIGAIVEAPEVTRESFNDVVSEFRTIVRGRMGLPMPENNLAVISLTVLGELDEINSFVGKLGKIDGVSVKTVFSKKDY